MTQGNIIINKNAQYIKKVKEGRVTFDLKPLSSLLFFFVNPPILPLIHGSSK